jgi:hypothetical protein
METYNILVMFKYTNQIAYWYIIEAASMDDAKAMAKELYPTFVNSPSYSVVVGQEVA